VHDLVEQNFIQVIDRIENPRVGGSIPPLASWP